MNIEIRTDKNIHGSDRLIDYVRTELKQQFQRYSEKITHFEVHLSDINGDRGGELDKRCMIEARPAGSKPVAVTHKADNIDLAIHGAIEKLKRSFEHALGKNDHGRGTRPDWSEA
ncbi:Sigma 54 modulation protein / S30EA ribosomal protein [Acinetobacter marinus]|uniref:Sigma 54 modulation protein / S30EA ribosomal protein n=1 Tax=Acinetobacter marinus TaxID=281375 RepID=A0A1G6KLY7_9GAMM|nr:HPF/RaiA family ribosome-associated protein [Acinetobacter marinus]SDC31974.1 Sigma 54 modulation protein / S30EA ribosomal protein [Acinetobacter marinus]